MKTITIITRPYPPNKGINGILANEMAGYLLNQGIVVNIVCIKGEMEGNKVTDPPQGNVFEIKPINNKKDKFKRMISLAFEGYTLIKKAKSLNGDLIICTTSPPLLPFWASVLLKKNNWALWSLDLFPEGFAASNIISNKNFFYKFLYKTTYKNAPKHLIALGEGQAKCIQDKYQKKIPTLILPAGVLLNKKDIVVGNKPTWATNNRITLGYFGNIGLPHNPSFLKIVIDQIQNKKDIQLLLAVYGIYADEIKEYAKEKENVIILEGGLPEEELSYIDIHLVSLKSSWTHVAVPSKAVTAISAGRPILFCGNEASDNWQMFKNCGWFLDEEKPIKEQISFFIQNLSKEAITKKAGNTTITYQNLKTKVLNTYNTIGTL